MTLLLHPTSSRHLSWQGSFCKTLGILAKLEENILFACQGMLLTCYLSKPYAWGTINTYPALPTSQKDVWLK